MNCIVVDDEAHAAGTLVEYIERTEGLSLHGAYNDPIEALNALKNDASVRLAFLDIDMPGITGLEMAGLLPNLAIVYVTGLRDYAVNAFEVNAYDFLLKPISYSKFLKSIDKVRSRVGTELTGGSADPDHIFINPGIKSKLVRLALTDIHRIEGLKNYVIIYTTNGKEITYLTMKEMQEALPADHFVRVHKSHIVNLAYISHIEGNMLTLSNQQTVPLGGVYKETLLSIIARRSIISKR